MAHRIAQPRLSRSGFQFSTDISQRIARTLGDFAPSVMPRLQTLVGDHVRMRQLRSVSGIGDHRHWSVRRNAPHVRREIRRHIAALRTVIRTLSGASPELLKAVRNHTTLGDLIGHPSLEESLTLTRRQAAASLRRLEGMLSVGARGGRPRDTDREDLAIEVALLLHSSGIRVTTSREGKFGSLLGDILLEIEGASAPIDCFRLIALAARIVNSSRDHFDAMIPYLVNPLFWSQLRVVH